VRQRTLAGTLRFEGIGLHGGQAVSCVVSPAPVDNGVVFQRRDRPGSPPIPARLEHVVGTELATTLGIDGVRVGTVEHLTAALRGMGVDNAQVQVDGAEIPVLDGSARIFVEAIASCGTVEQEADATVLRVVDSVELVDEASGRRSRLDPADDFLLECEIAFDHPLLAHQAIHFCGGPERFAAEIAPARTFGLLADVERMHAAGLALGGSLENAVVFGPDEVLNPGGLRFDDECVRHKVLDMIGDLSLLGAVVLGRFSASRSGHEFNLRLVREALDRGAITRDAPPLRSLSASG
jgi:UDP-3-O-[3-hydroxymyristoyl] N-acetylglucosamine deacetylase